MNNELNNVERVIGFDSHPDSFTAALLQGKTPAEAVVQKTFNKVPLDRLKSWAQKNTNPADLFVLEASGNSFQIVRLLEKLGRRGLVLESGHLGKLKEAHANNDQISAIRIAKAFLAGTAKKVWIPDLKTQERRDWFHAHRKAVKRTTQTRNRLLSYLSDNGVRLKRGTELTSEEAAKSLQQLHSWSERQRIVLGTYLLELRHADEQRKHWRKLIAQEVASEPKLLELVRLCGVRDLIAFALGAIIGDIKRFATPKALVKYVGLNPAFDHSGQGQWQGGIGGHGRQDLRSLLIEAGQALLRSTHPMAQWGKKLLARKSSVKLAVAALARKLTVAVWYLMMGRWTPLLQIDQQLQIKISKIITQLGARTRQARTDLRLKIEQHLKRAHHHEPSSTTNLEPDLVEAYATP